MDETKAREILKDAIQPDNRLYNLSWYLCQDDESMIVLDAQFELQELKAIIWWMENMPILPSPK